MRDAEQALGRSTSLPLTDAVVKAYFKTLAYKDEYEVARLHTGSGFIDQLREEYGQDAKIRFHLAPPLMPSGRDARGRPFKREFGAWMIPLFRLLARGKRLRGTAFDVFGKTAERRMERALIGEFEATVATLLSGLTAANLSQAAEIVKLYLDIRGYGPVKEQSAQEVRSRIQTQLGQFTTITGKAA